ncbi:hypothetical protein D9M68_844720 [compost metagenome]
MAVNDQTHCFDLGVVSIDERHNPLRITEFRRTILVPGARRSVLRLRHLIWPVRHPRLLERVDEVQDQVIPELVQPLRPVVFVKLIQDRNDHRGRAGL